MHAAAIAVAAAISVVAAGCGGSSHSAAPSSGSSAATSPATSGSAGQKTYTVGVLGDMTGLASATSKDMTAAIKAGIGVAAEQGYKIKFVLADTQSSPTGALTAAKKLVEQDHVFAVLAISDLTFGAAPYLASQGIPVIGAAVDGTEWSTERNMFSIMGTPNYTKVDTGAGKFYKLVGATDIGAIGYGLVPSAAQTAKETAISVEAAGLKAGYINAQFPLGSTNVGPIVLAMKNAGIDGLSVLVQQNTGFAIISGLRKQGVELKAPVLFAGYGSDLLEAGPGAMRDAQNVYFSLSYEPVEMHTPATEKFQRALQKYAGYTQVPGLNEYLGYVSVDGFVTGLKAAGPNPTRASYIKAMLGVTKYDAAGLFGDHSVSFAMDQRGQERGPDNCLWYTKFQGTTFHLVRAADPICGAIIPGKTVSSS